MADDPFTKYLASYVGKSQTQTLESLFRESASRIDDILNTDLSVTETRMVPTTKDVGFTAGKVLTTAVLFIDLRDSTGLSDGHHRRTITKTYKAFFDCIGKIISFKSGAHIRGYAGDRLMAVFTPSETVCNTAVDTGIIIQTAVNNILNKKLNSKFGIELGYGIGIAYGEIMVGRIGIYGGGSNSDLVWSGDTTNFASKLADHRGKQGSGIRITNTVYNKLTAHKYYDGGGEIWSDKEQLIVGSKAIIYRYNTSAHKTAIDNI